MSHTSDRALSDKRKILNVFHQHSKTEKKWPVNRLTADCKCNCYNMTDGQHKIKRRKTRKERSQMRGGGRECSKTESHHHHCACQSSKDVPHFHNCCHSNCYCPAGRDTQFLNVIPAAQEPSIITDNRLIGHHGLFNHEVKSIDIERLLGGQRKQEKSGDQVQDKNHAILHPSSTSHTPPPLSRKALVGAVTNEVVAFEKKAGDAITTSDDCWEKEKKISQGSDITPHQRPQQQLDPSSGSYKSIFSSKHCSLGVVMIKSKMTNTVRSEKIRESQLCPTGDREKVKTLNKKLKTQMAYDSTSEHTSKNQNPPTQQTQAHSLSPSPLQLSESFDKQHKTKDASCVSKSVSAVAARLCDSLHFPFLKRRNLVTESRNELLRALQERHGPQLQENLLKVQQPKEGQDEKPAMIDEDVLFPADASAFPPDTAIHPPFDTQRTTALKITRSRHFNLSSLQPHRSLARTAECLASPVATSASLLEDIFSSSPQFFLDSEPSGVSASDYLFSPSATSCWVGKASKSQHCEDSFNTPKTKESFMFDSFEKSFMKHSRLVTESCGPHYTGSHIQPFFPYPTQLPDGLSEPVQFPQLPNTCITDRYSYAPSFSAQFHHPNQNNHFQTFNQFSDFSACPSLRSHHIDMMRYPPSHMLERDPAPPFCSFPTPEHWSFPPMRLY